MNFRKPSSRWALWVFAAALLLKSAMPWLASSSAELQGKTLVEVCSVYGVALVPLVSPGDSPHAPPADHPSDHGAEHCTLTALTVLASADPPALAPAAPRHFAHRAPAARRAPQAPDACAAWVARLKHGPPAFA